MNDLFAELGVPGLRRSLRAADPSPAIRKSRDLSSIIQLIDTQNRQRAHRPTLPRQPPHSPDISTLVMRSHNIQKTRDIFTMIATNLHEGLHIQALQEVNMPILEIQRKLLSLAPGAIAQGYTNGSTNGVVTVIHPDLAPYVRAPCSLMAGVP